MLPEIAVAKVDEKAPLEKVCLLGCGITTYVDHLSVDSIMHGLVFTSRICDD